MGNYNFNKKNNKMKENILEIKTKIIALDEVFSEYELRPVLNLSADLFVYSYATGSYDGSGFAVWRKGNDWFYSDLGHCSCNGPTEDISTSNNAAFKYEQVKEIATKKNYHNHAENVIKYIEEHKLYE